jgi:hypothetical protein
MTKLRAVLALLAVAAAAALTLGLATPAHAAINPCPDGPHAPPCADYLLWSSPYDDGCPQCPEYAMGFVETRYVPDADRWRYLNDMRDGIQLLYQARVTQNPQARYAAWKKFEHAATMLDGACILPNVVGTYDRKTGRLDPRPMPWLKAAAVDFAEGEDGWCGTPVPGFPPWPHPAPDPWAPFDAGLDALLSGAQGG